MSESLSREELDKLPTIACKGCGRRIHIGTPAPTVPRVAESIDDLRVGQVVVNRWTGMKPEFGGVYTLREQDIDDYRNPGVEKPTVIILSDPPPEPLVLSPKAQGLFDRLATRIEDGGGYFHVDVSDAAVAFVREVRGW